ncbi:MAG: hypothetical protein WBK77_07515 [Alphaproteobacteria bacterium]
MFEDPEQRQNRKIRKIARNGAFALGGGVGLWFMNALYPYEKEAENMASLFGYVAMLLIAYGIIVLPCIIFKRKLAVPVNALMVWLVLPALLFMIFSKFWTG